MPGNPSVLPPLGATGIIQNNHYHHLPPHLPLLHHFILSPPTTLPHRPPLLSLPLALSHKPLPNTPSLRATTTPATGHTKCFPRSTSSIVNANTLHRPTDDNGAGTMTPDQLAFARVGSFLFSQPELPPYEIMDCDFHLYIWSFNMPVLEGGGQLQERRALRQPAYRQ